MLPKLQHPTFNAFSLGHATSDTRSLFGARPPSTSSVPLPLPRWQHPHLQLTPLYPHSHTFNDLYPHRLLSIQPTEALRPADIHTTIRNTKGARTALYGSVPQDAFEMLVCALVRVCVQARSIRAGADGEARCGAGRCAHRGLSLGAHDRALLCPLVCWCRL